MKTYYAGLDVGSTVCELAVIDEDGTQVYASQFTTSERNLIVHIKEARKRVGGELRLTFEEGEMAQWVASVMRPEVNRVVVADPKRNAWIARDARKADKVDARKLAQLLRGGFLNEVYHPEDEDRAEFKRAVQHYHDLTRTQAGLRASIKSKLRAHGLIVRGASPFSKDGRDKALCLLPNPASRHMVRQLYELLDAARKVQGQARDLMVAMGRRYPEIARFQEAPGIGEIWSCTFSAYVQTPHRFRSKRKLWRFSQLSITDRSSNGEPLGFKRLERNGVRMLKHLSYRAFLSNMQSGGDFKTYFEQVLQRTNDRTHARLTTQRKILAVLWAMWKRNETYRPLGENKTEAAIDRV